MRKIAVLVATLVLGTSFIASDVAEAKVYKWNNTRVVANSLQVKFCDGSVRTLKNGQSTSKDVCAIWTPNNIVTNAWVEETQTNLFRKYKNCGPGQWLKFNSKTDSKRHVNVFQTYSSNTICV